jgi:hypothetical protein
VTSGVRWGNPQSPIREEYHWFAIAVEGALPPISRDQEENHATLVALPAKAKDFLGKGLLKTGAAF